MKKEDYKLEFIVFDVSKSLFERGTGEREYEFSIEAKQAIVDLDEDDNTFRSSFLISIESLDEDKPLSIQVEAGGVFKIHDSPPNDVIENFKFISAPSIVYPYVRAFIANLTLNSGINPINLPAVNFANQYWKQRESK